MTPLESVQAEAKAQQIRFERHIRFWTMCARVVIIANALIAPAMAYQRMWAHAVAAVVWLCNACMWLQQIKSDRVRAAFGKAQAEMLGAVMTRLMDDDGRPRAVDTRPSLN